MSRTSNEKELARKAGQFAIGKELNVNRLGYGAMRISGKGIWGPPASKTDAIRVLRRAMELGVNFIDTADSYGPNVSEELMSGGQEKSIFLSQRDQCGGGVCTC